MKVISIKAGSIESIIPVDLIEEVKKVNTKYDFIIEVYMRNKSNKRVFLYDKESDRDDVFNAVNDSLSFSDEEI